MKKKELPKEEPKDSNWVFHSEDSAAPEEVQDDTQVNAPEPKAVTWSASEYIAHDKSLSWFVMAGLAVAVLAVIAFFATDQSWFSALLVLIAGATFTFFAAQQPRVLEYVLDSQGLRIANKVYYYHQFKSFSIVNDGAINAIVLQPLERFMPSLSLYYEPKDEDKIAKVLAVYLPYEAREIAQVDKLMRKIRF